MSSSPAVPASSHRPGILLVVATLLIYSALSFLRHSEKPIWDEQRYLDYASHLTQGFYVTAAEPDIVNGPAYPMVLMPFVGGGPDAWRLARILNAFFMAAAVGFVWLTVRHYAGAGWAFAGAFITAFHPTMLWMGFALMTEPMSTFAFTGFVWAYTHALRDRGWKWLLAAIVFFGWLILTRVFFGHVLMATAALSVGLLLIKEWRPALLRTLIILAGALLFCSPYLAYTQSKTGQFLCWSTNSGELLYWMSSHHEGENGHWFGKADVRTREFLNPVHREFYRDLLTHPILEREERLKAAAVANFKANPARVAYNWVCNLTRLAFGFPRSHQPEELRTIVLIAFNGPLIVLAVLAGLLGLRFWRTVPVEIWLLMGMAAFYLGGSSLAPSLPRYFALMVPVLWLGIAHVFSRHLRVSVTG
ncbi:MAG: glycosyltransferase family 39 protein [Verrucomicrobiota bacterium]